MPHFRKEAAIISDGMAFHACEIHEQISSSEAFFCRPVAVNSWIPSAIHCIQCFRTPSLNGLFKDTSSGWRREVNPPGITASSVFSRLKDAFTVSVTWASNGMLCDCLELDSRTLWHLPWVAPRWKIQWCRDLAVRENWKSKVYHVGH